MGSIRYKELILEIIARLEKYKTINEITGQNFNVFRILKLESAEVRMHSAFLAELLNPSGSHGQKDIFLNLFIKQFNFKYPLIDSKSCCVEIEKHVGFISKDGMNGGRLDIFISDRSENHIIIENKINAVDNENQLIRYNNYSKQANLFYLTLDGKLPSTQSSGSLKVNEHYKCLSYKDDIINWLESCRKEMTIVPIVRESISHYINLLKYLTNQTLNEAMQMELNEVIKSNMQASIAIADNLRKAQLNIINDFTGKLNASLMDRGVECFTKINFEKNFSGFYISKPEWGDFNIAFQFQLQDKELVYGIAAKRDPSKYEFPNSLRNSIEGLFPDFKKQTKWWPFMENIEQPYDNWHNHITWEAIDNGIMERIFIDKIDWLLAQLKKIAL